MKGRFTVRTVALLWALMFLSPLNATPLPMQVNTEEVRLAENEEAQYKAASRQAMQNAIARTFRYHNRELSYNRAMEYASYVIEAARRYSVDPALIAGLVIRESRGRANARSKYAVGLMQIYWRVHRKSIRAQFPHIQTQADVMKPRNNVFVGTWLFSGYLRASQGDVKKALSRYLGAKNDRYISQVQGYRQQILEQLQ